MLNTSAVLMLNHMFMSNHLEFMSNHLGFSGGDVSEIFDPVGSGLHRTVWPNDSCFGRARDAEAGVRGK